MAFDPRVFEQPVDGPDPCGPDLEAEGDPLYQNFMAEAEGLMPASFFSFDLSAFPAETMLETAAGLLARTRDVRLLVITGKILILSRNLAGFVAAIDSIRRAFEDNWDEVHPQGDGSDYSFRVAPIYNLDDAASLVFPLQAAPLVEAGRSGVVTYRHHLLSIGQVKPREGDNFDAGHFDRALLECDLGALVAARDTVRRLRSAITAIQNTIIAKAGYEHAVGLDRLPPVIDGMAAFLTAAVLRRDPNQEDGAGDGSEAVAEGGAEAAPTPVLVGQVASQAAAAAALDAVLDYYARREPSSPAFPLVRQARESVGKTLYEVMAMLVPTHADAARINVGAEPAFNVPLKSAGSKAAPAGAAADALPPLSNRSEAIALMEQVSTFYRQAEPSSPVPLLIERARALSSRDFLTLLKDLLPEAALKTMKIT